MKTLRAGILGVGGVAHKHAHAIAQLRGHVELAACCGRSESKTRAFAEQYTAGRALVFSDHHEMFDRGQLDVVIVCLPPFAHGDEVERAAERKIHLLMEKPVALDSEQAWNMVNAAERAGIQTQVSFMYRFGAAVEQFRARLDAGETGPVGLMTASYFSNSLHAPWWRERAKSGGQIIEQAIHLFDLLRYFGGKATRIYSRRANLFHRDIPAYDIEDVSATIVEFANGALGVVSATNAAVPNQWLKEWRVVTRNMVAEFSDWNHATFTLTGGPNLVRHSVRSEQDVFVAQLQDLIRAIATGGKTRTPLREGAQSLDLALAAVRSGDSRVPLDLQT